MVVFGAREVMGVDAARVARVRRSVGIMIVVESAVLLADHETEINGLLGRFIELKNFRCLMIDVTLQRCRVLVLLLSTPVSVVSRMCRYCLYINCAYLAKGNYRRE